MITADAGNAAGDAGVDGRITATAVPHTVSVNASVIVTVNADFALAAFIVASTDASVRACITTLISDVTDNSATTSISISDSISIRITVSLSVASTTLFISIAIAITAP
jgi:hypothetical protein